MNHSFSYDRYQRQIILKNFGEAAQLKLLQASVLVVGAGGLGVAALQYLAGAGVGTIGIVDNDTVSLSNLPRQVLYSTHDISASKALRAAAILKEQNPEINCIAYPFRLDTDNALDLIAQFDLVLDGTDNFASKYLLNDACVLLNKPWVYGAVSQYEGQLAVLNAGNSRVNYRDMFPVPPNPDEVLNCADAGVLGVLPGIIGTMQANETIKWITGTGVSLVNRLFNYNALNNQTYEIALSQNTGSGVPAPASRMAFENFDYETFCGNNLSLQLDPPGLNKMMNQGPVTIIDVRLPNEMPRVLGLETINIPLAELEHRVQGLAAETIVTVCSTGTRSLQAAHKLSAIFGKSKKVYSLQGGINHWNMQFEKDHHVSK